MTFTPDPSTTFADVEDMPIQSLVYESFALRLSPRPFALGPENVPAGTCEFNRHHSFSPDNASDSTNVRKVSPCRAIVFAGPYPFTNSKPSGVEMIAALMR